MVVRCGSLWNQGQESGAETGLHRSLHLGSKGHRQKRVVRLFATRSRVPFHRVFDITQVRTSDMNKLKVIMEQLKIVPATNNISIDANWMKEPTVKINANKQRILMGLLHKGRI